MATEAADPLLVRPAEPGDLAEVAELFLATRRASADRIPLPVADDDTVRADFARLLDHSLVWVAEDEELLGFAVLTGDWLESLYVGAAHQGRGVGSMLLEVVMAHRPGGFGLWVFAANTEARGFYHRHGLLELEHTDGSGNAEGAPDVRMFWPGRDPLVALRGEIDQVDDALAQLLARRFALTGAIQGFKANPGRSGRDPGREAEIAARMAGHVPGLGVEAIARIMDVVISESLDAHDAGAAVAEDATGTPAADETLR